MLRNYWYIACASSRLDNAPRAVRVLDQEIVVYRDREGKPHALLDRCCHRGVRLSLGRVCANGTLACGYHGWQYDGDGQCVHIPSLVDGKRIPKGFTVPAFPCVEQDAYIWVWMGAGEPTPAQPDAIPDLRETEYVWRQGEAHFKCNNTMVIENQFDIIHPAFVHVETHPAYYFARALGPRNESFEVRVTEKGLIAFGPPTNPEEDAPIPEKPFFQIIWELPDRVWVRTSMLVLLTHIVPTGKNTCRMEWIERKGKGTGINWDPAEHQLTEQDRIMETAQEWYDREGDDFERSVEVDFVTLLVRKVVALAAADNWEAGKESLTQRRVIQYRLAAAG